MSRVIKITIAIVSIVVILIFAGYVAIRSFLTPERARRVTEQIATQSLQRPVKVGRVNLSIGFKISISVSDVSVPNVEGFSTQPMIQIERTLLNLKLLPLLQRRIVIGSINFDQLTLNLERNTDKELNILALMPKEAKGPGWAISLDKLHLKKCEFKYYDAVTKSEYRLHDINQEIRFRQSLISIKGNQRALVPNNKILPEKDILIENAVEYDTSSKDVRIRSFKVRLDPALLTVSGSINKSRLFDLDGEISVKDMSKALELLPDEYRFERLNGAVNGTFSLSGTTEEPKIEGTCEIKDVTVMPKGMIRAAEKINGTLSFNRSSVRDIIIGGKIGKTEFNIAGYVTNLDSPTPLLNITTRLNGNLQDLQSITPETKDIKLSGILATDISLKGTLKNPKYFGDISIGDASIDGIGLGKPVSGLSIKGNIQNDAVRISECRGRIGKSDFSLSGFVSNFKKPVVQINSRSNLIDLDELLPPKGTAAGSSGKGTAGKPIPLTLQGNVIINRLTGIDMEFTNVNANFSYVDGIIDLKNCRAQAFDGQVYFDFYYNAYSPEPYRINTRMTSVQAQKITKRFLGFDRIKGNLSGIANLNGNGLDQQSVRSNINGSGNLKISNGEFNNFDFLMKLLAWMGLKDQKVVKFNDFNTGFRIANGRAIADDWTLSARVGNFLTKGTIGLNGVVDLRIAITLSKHYSDIVKGYHGDWIFFSDKDGRTVVDVIAKGKFNAPQFTLDRNSIQQRIKGNIKNEFDKKIKDFESNLKDILKGIK